MLGYIGFSLGLPNVKHLVTTHWLSLLRLAVFYIMQFNYEGIDSIWHYCLTLNEHLPKSILSLTTWFIIPFHFPFGKSPMYPPQAPSGGFVTVYVKFMEKDNNFKSSGKLPSISYFPVYGFNSIFVVYGASGKVSTLKWCPCNNMNKQVFLSMLWNYLRHESMNLTFFDFFA